MNSGGNGPASGSPESSLAKIADDGVAMDGADADSATKAASVASPEAGAPGTEKAASANVSTGLKAGPAQIETGMTSGSDDGKPSENAPDNALKEIADAETSMAASTTDTAIQPGPARTQAGGVAGSGSGGAAGGSAGQDAPAAGRSSSSMADKSINTGDGASGVVSNAVAAGFAVPAAGTGVV